MVYFGFVPNFGFAFGRMNVEINQLGINVDEQVTVGVGPARQHAAITVSDRLHQCKLIDCPVVDIDFYVGPVRPPIRWRGRHRIQAKFSSLFGKFDSFGGNHVWIARQGVEYPLFPGGGRQIDF